MIVTFELFGEKLQHMTAPQFGAFTAYCMAQKNFHSIKLYKTRIEVCFNTNKAVLDVPTCEQAIETREELGKAMDAFASMEPFPCPCGCGAFISVSPCLRQSGTLVEGFSLNADEKRELAEGRFIPAIKMVRTRYGGQTDATGYVKPYLGLREAKDLCDAYRAEIAPGQPNNTPVKVFDLRA